MKISTSLKRVILAEFILPVALLIVGIFNGVMQVFYRSGVLHADAIHIGGYSLNYYQGLTLHGVINAIVLTTFFAVAFGHAVITYYLKKEPPKFTYVLSFWLMLIGTLIDAVSMLLPNRSQALFTFYPPLKAGWEFYVGTAILVVGSWVAFFGWIPVWFQFKRENPERRMPVAVLGTYVTHTIWLVCTLPAAYITLIMLTPWSVGWTSSINVSLERTLFWMFGHPLVYFWLLPTYIMYYTVLPKIAGGKLFSSNAARLSFLLFLILSIPVGVHHQFTEPALAQGVKFYQTVLTYCVAIPSLLTAFTVAASLEYAGRRRGSKGWFGWMCKLPYLRSDNFLFGYMICGLILFIFGGLTGFVNASYSLDQVVHNTAWIPGHFHMTVGGPVFLGIVGMTLYLYGKLTGKDIRCKKLATIFPYMWMIGMAFFSHGLMAGGLMGEPRRTNMGFNSYTDPSSSLFNSHYVLTSTVTLIGGVIMATGALLYFISFFGTVFSKPVREDELVIPVAEDLHEEREVGAFLNMKPWVIIMLILIIVSYTTPIIDALDNNRAVPVPNKFEPSNPANQINNPANTAPFQQ